MPLPIPYQAEADALRGDTTPLVGSVTVEVPAESGVTAATARLVVRAASPKGRPTGAVLVSKALAVAFAEDGLSYAVDACQLDPDDWDGAVPSGSSWPDQALAEIEAVELDAGAAVLAVRTLARVVVTVHPDVAQ